MANHRLSQLYSKAPIFVQNIAVSAMGLMLETTRKGGFYIQHRKALASRTGWAESAFMQYQLEQCRELIDYARAHVPYYKQVFGDADISSKTISSLEDMRKVPILSRDMLKNRHTELLSDKYLSSRRISINTTGTTGSPLKIECDKHTRQNNYAFFDNYLESIGVDPGARHIIIGGRLIAPQKNNNPPYWRYSYFQKSLLMSSYHLSDSCMEAYLNKIVSFAPEYIESYPSSIFSIAKYMLMMGKQLECKAIVTSAETLFPEQREVIEKAFNTTVYDQYGCAEMCLFVGQCSHGNYHVRPDYGILELVDDDGNLVKKGEPGKVVCTGFINRVMPFIRYSIGDMATYSEEDSCQCGLETPILKAIQGRIDDTLITRDGRLVGRMSPVLKGFPIKESQYVQYNVGEVDVLIVPDAKFSSDQDIDRIIDAVQLRLGNDCKVNIHLVEKIERGRGGKLKSTVSYVNMTLGD